MKLTNKIKKAFSQEFAMHSRVFGYKLTCKNVNVKLKSNNNIPAEHAVLMRTLLSGVLYIVVSLYCKNTDALQSESITEMTSEKKKKYVGNIKLKSNKHELGALRINVHLVKLIRLLYICYGLDSTVFILDLLQFIFNKYRN